MFRSRLFRAVLSTAFLLLPGVIVAQSKSRSSASRIIDDADRVVRHGNVHPEAQAQFDVGPTDLSFPMERMVLAVSPRPSARQALARFLRDVHDPSSPVYHQWLTPEQFGKRFGVSDSDLSAVIGWLQGHGFAVDEVARGRGWINFSGTAAQVEQAFRTNMHDYVVEGKLHHANSNDPSIPRGMADIVEGVVSLHDFAKKPMNSGIRPVPQETDPEYTSGTSHYISPGDFAIIYNVNALYSAGFDGTGQTIAIVGRTHPSATNWSTFRTTMNLPSNPPQVVVNGADPGDLGAGEDGEADLDVEWSGAVAKKATVKFVVSKSTSTTDGVDLSAQYIVNNNLAPVMSTSFGQCESSMGSAENTFYNNLWSQAAAQGITSFVSSGDSGASGCDGGSSTSGTGRAISGLASTPFNVAVGGTQFNEGSGTYWSTTNSTGDVSALSYIPEVAWNESGTVSGGSGLWATSGGVSTIYNKPSWQVAPGVPADGKRDIPDVSLTAAGHDGYLVETQGSLSGIGGTSASSPSFAGLMALIVQKTGQRQGNANTVFYSMGNTQYTGGTVVYHDTTSGNNSVPGVTGFSCGTGYDLATGLGSVDANALANNWGGAPPVPDFAISASPGSVSIAQGSSGSSTVSTTVSGGFNSSVALSASGQPSGVTVSFSPSSIAAPGSGSSTMTITVAAGASVGSSTITVTGSGGSKTHTASVSLSVTAAGALTAAYDATLKAPKCAQLGSSCDSGPSLLLGRSTLGPEPNQPNTINSACTDGASGTFHSDESNDRLKVFTTDGSNFAPGKTVTVQATVWAYSTFSSDKLDLYYAPNASSPVWTLIATLSPTVAGSQVLSANYTLPSGGSLQAVRANFRYQGSASSCSTGAYDDHDDLVFAVSSTPDFAISASPASASVVQGNSGSSTISTTVSGGFNSAVSLSASGQPAGVTVSFSPASIAAPGSGSSTMTLAVASSTATGTYPITVTGSGGSATHTTSVSLTVTAAPVPNFTISASPGSVSVLQGNSGTSTVSTAVSGGFNSAIALSASGQPAGVTVSFSPASIAAPGSGSSTMTMAVASSTAAGTYTITVTGTGGSITKTSTVSLTVTSGAASQLLGNPGFESGNVTWTATTSVIDSSTGEAAHSGSWKAWLDGYGAAHTDSILQQVAIPSTVTTATLSFWLHIDTAETTTTSAFDTLKVQIRNSSGTVLATLATYSNLNKNTGYAQKSFNVSAYKGQTIQVYLVGVEDGSLQTSFVVDDFALNVQ